MFSNPNNLCETNSNSKNNYVSQYQWHMNLMTFVGPSSDILGKMNYCWSMVIKQSIRSGVSLDSWQCLSTG